MTSAAHSRLTGKTFARITDIVKHHFTDPEIGPRAIANEARVSLRYLRKFLLTTGQGLLRPEVRVSSK